MSGTNDNTATTPYTYQELELENPHVGSTIGVGHWTNFSCS